jgi:hypothetical protein
MKHWMSIALALYSLSSAIAAPSYTDVVEETLYQNFKANLGSSSQTKSTLNTGLTSDEQKLFVDALWDLADENNQEAVKALDEVETFHFDLSDRLRVEILRLRHKNATRISYLLKKDIENNLRSPTPDKKLIYLIAAYEVELIKAGSKSLVNLAKKHPEYSDISEESDKNPTANDKSISDLFHHTPDVSTYMNGEYIKSVKIFHFCRTNRLYPCLMVMKDIHGKVVRKADGSIWTNKSLASSKHGLPSYIRNGHTPTGIFTIDSVMPVADQQLSYGKFRRMILNFVPKSADEKLLKSLLPPSSQQEDWWKSSVTARDMGRNLFRIHGTSKINPEPNVPFYPFVRTSGCIAQRENYYDGVTYLDQRNLLDSIMKAMDLRPTYENELKVKGIVYTVEIDDENAPVEAHDLALRGIE